MKVNRNAWKPGALWTAETFHGYLEAIIVGPSRNGHKIIQMSYTTGRYKNRPVRQEYSHRHMTKYFKLTKEVRPIPEEPK